ncbi:MAG: protein kinase domain-containing protein, partial [Pirellulales bacterium]
MMPEQNKPDERDSKQALGRDLYATQARTPEEPEPGLRYRPLRPHARGGLGEVLVAQDEELHREVALKQIQDRFADDEPSRSRFVLEAEITGGLEHPGIVPVYGLGTYADGRPYYAMRFIRGLSFKDAVDEFHGAKETNPGQRALEFRKLLARLVSVCQALEYAHSRGVIHRDVKPGNIMLGKFGETLVVDWGLAKLVGRPESHRAMDELPIASQSITASMPTMMGTALGTPQFMSPEQAFGRLDLIDSASDVYSLGATLYYLLCGRAPFEETDLNTILQHVQRGQFAPPRSVNKTAPPGLDAICLKAMALEQKDRYPSAAALADDLEHWLADEPISALPESFVQRALRWSRHHRAWALSGVAALLLVAVASSVAMFFVDRERRRADKNAADAIDARGKEEDARRHAERQARIANASRLSLQSRESQRSMPQRSLLLAVESLKATTSHDEPPLAECRQALCDALAVAGGVPLVGQAAALQTVALSHDGRWAATGGDTVRLWDLTAAVPSVQPLVLSGHTRAVWAIAFSHDDHWLATAGKDHQARVWDLTAPNPLTKQTVLAGHTDSINALAFSRDAHWLATVSDDKTARLWDMTASMPGKSAAMLTGHDAVVDVLAFSDDGHWLATGDGALDAVAEAKGITTGTVRLWDLMEDDPASSVQLLRGHTDAILATAISPDSHWLVTASADGTAREWDLTASNIPNSAMVLAGLDAPIHAVAISSNSRRLFAGSYDGTIRVWSLGDPDLSPTQSLRAHDGVILSLAVSGDGKWLASGSADKTARLWDLEKEDPGASGVILRGHESDILALALRGDGRLLLTAGGDNAARLWDFERSAGAAMPELLRGHTNTIIDLAASPDGQWLAAASADRTTSLWKAGAAGSGKRLTLAGHKQGVWRLAFDPTGRWLATASYDKTARLWNLKATDPAKDSVELAGHEGPLGTTVFSPDGRRLATGSTDHTVRLWNTTAPDPNSSPAVLQGHDDEVLSLAVSRDGKWLFSGSKDKTVRRWDLQAEHPEQKSVLFRRHDSAVDVLGISPDGHWLLAAGEQPLVHVWNVADLDSETPRALSAHHYDVLAAAFSPDGKWLASADADGLVCLWKMGDDGPDSEPSKLRGHDKDKEVRTLAFSADGRWLVTASYDRTALVYDLTAADPTSEPLVLHGFANEV